ncbi:DUF4430 domain-containing protein [Candidatus Woesearchaeota archaeon]|nr:DUF4430 domain-containing protein [Candidatus Woesearchaeota archaeon]
MNPGKYYLALIVLVLVVPVVYSERVGVFVEFPYGLESDCVDVPLGATAKEALEMSKFTAEYSYGGRFLDSINGLAGDYTEHISWWFYYNEGKATELSPVGITDYRIDGKGYFVYFGYYPYDESFMPKSSPKAVAFYDACPVNMLILRDVYVETSEGIVELTNDSIILGKPGELMRLHVRLKNDILGEEFDGEDQEVHGEVTLRLKDGSYKGDFSIQPDETEEVTLEFEFPYMSAGHYRGFLNVKGYDRFNSYIFNRRLVFGVKPEGSKQTPAVIQEQTTTTVPAEQTQANRTPTGAYIAPPVTQEKSPWILVGVLGGIVVLLMIVFVFVLRK